MLVTGVQGTGKSTVANSVAEVLGAAVLAHDWAMSGLRPFPEIQAALDAMDPPGHRVVGWSILKALAQEQLQRGSSVVLDGVARAPQIALCRRMAQELSAKLVVIMTECSDLEVHRSRIEGRKRAIPNSAGPTSRARSPNGRPPTASTLFSKRPTVGKTM